MPQANFDNADCLDEEERVLAHMSQSQSSEGAFEAPPDESDDSGVPGPSKLKDREENDKFYDLMENVDFPEEEIKGLLGEASLQWVMKLRNALQMPFASVLLALLSLSSFALHRTEVMYTRMLGLPPLPWFIHLGRKGEGKSILVWLQKQVALELQDRENQSRRSAAKTKKRKQNAPADDIEAASPPAAAAADIEAIDPEHAEDKKTADVAYTADTRTLYGMGPKLQNNGGRLLVSLHEGKPLLSKILHDTPGCDPQALNKLFDRDEFSNTVLTSASKFSVRQPWANNMRTT